MDIHSVAQRSGVDDNSSSLSFLSNTIYWSLRGLLDELAGVWNCFVCFQAKTTFQAS